MGQYYSVGLDNGETVIVYLDDAVVKLPRNGGVRLPTGRTQRLCREGWYAGHYHVESEEGDIRIMFEDYDEICEEAE